MITEQVIFPILTWTTLQRRNIWWLIFQEVQLSKRKGKTFYGQFQGVLQLASLSHIPFPSGPVWFTHWDIYIRHFSSLTHKSSLAFGWVSSLLVAIMVHLLISLPWWMINAFQRLNSVHWDSVKVLKRQPHWLQRKPHDLALSLRDDYAKFVNSKRHFRAVLFFSHDHYTHKNISSPKIFDKGTSHVTNEMRFQLKTGKNVHILSLVQYLSQTCRCTPQTYITINTDNFLGHRTFTSFLLNKTITVKAEKIL